MPDPSTRPTSPTSPQPGDQAPAVDQRPGTSGGQASGAGWVLPGDRRWWAVGVGLVGAVLLALAGYGAGARPHHSPIGVLPTWATLTGDPAYGLAILAWLVGTALLVAGWWLLRRGPSGGPPVRLVLLATALWAVPLLLAPPLGSRDIYAYAAQGDLYAHGFDPYRVGPAAYPSPWLPEMSPAWLHAVVPYGPLALLVMRLAAWASGGNLLVVLTLLRLAALAGLLLTAAYLPRLARAAGIPPGAATWLGLASPLLLIHLVSGAHNDALMIGLLVAGLALAAGHPADLAESADSSTAPAPRAAPATAAALSASVGRGGVAAAGGGGWAWVWGRAVPAGAALALAGAVKATALVVVPFAVVLVLPAVAGRWRFWRAAAAVVGSVVVAFGVVTAVSGVGFGWVGALAGTADSVQWTSVPTGVGMAIAGVLSALGLPGGGAVHAICTDVALYLVLPVILVALWWPVRHGPGSPRAAGDTGGSGLPRAAGEMGGSGVPGLAGDGPELAGVARVVRRAGWALVALVACSPAAHPWYVLWGVAVLAAGLRDVRVVRGIAVALVALAFLALPDGYNLARVTVWLGAPVDVAIVVVLVVVGIRAYRRWALARRPR